MLETGWTIPSIGNTFWCHGNRALYRLHVARKRKKRGNQIKKEELNDGAEGGGC